MKITDPQIINLASEMDACFKIYIYKESKEEANEAAETFSKMLDKKFENTEYPDEKHAIVTIGNVLEGIAIGYHMSDEDMKEYYLEKARKLEKEG